VQDLFVTRPGISFAFWRMTLIDAAIFRQTITNNTARPTTPRLAHLFCEQYWRAKNAGLLSSGGCEFPVNQTQLAQALGMSLVSLNRALQRLRQRRLLEFRSGRLQILDWEGLSQLGEFDPTYLYAKRESSMSRTVFKSRGS
jgi:CRP-like cAMP-binding protein